MAAIDVDASFRSLEDCFENLENVLNCAGNPKQSCVKMQELLWKDQNPELEEKVQFWEETKFVSLLKIRKLPAFGFRNESKLSKFVPEFEVPESKLERL
ncbi:hypothetical protein TNCV_4239751 [Trichonephila clavipes]|nr:hypothetical protein TNCV_4239751 [Trichonephila clavipes]